MDNENDDNPLKPNIPDPLDEDPLELDEATQDYLDQAVDYVYDDMPLDDNEDPTPMAAENKAIGRTMDHEKFFHDLFLEVLDFEKGFDNAKVSLTTALLNQGADFNPQGVYGYIGMLNERLVRIHIVKRLCMAIGLATEMDSIIDHEMQLIYQAPKPQARRMTTDDLRSPIAGEPHG